MTNAATPVTVSRHGLRVAAPLAAFIESEVLPGTGIDTERFAPGPGNPTTRRATGPSSRTSAISSRKVRHSRSPRSTSMTSSR